MNATDPSPCPPLPPSPRARRARAGVRAALWFAALAAASCAPPVEPPRDAAPDDAPADTPIDQHADAPPDASSDAGADVGAGADGDATAAPRCNDVIPRGPYVLQRAIAEPPPPPAGGAIADGTYELTELRMYTGAPDGGAADAGASEMLLPVRATVVVRGGTLETAVEQPGMLARVNVAFTATGTQLVERVTCNSAGSGPSEAAVQYTATATTLALFNSPTVVQHLERRP